MSTNGFGPDSRAIDSTIITASWMRCRQYGLAPHARMQPYILGDSDLRLCQERNQLLRRIALKEIHPLQKELAGSGHVLLLADAQGVVLDSHGDPGFLGRAGKVCLGPGMFWDERVAGTNAIGTAVVEKRALQIIGSQHFFSEARTLACTAMPIHSPEGILAGVLDVTGYAYQSTEAAAQLVERTVANIERRWTVECATDLLVHLHRDPAGLGKEDEGLLLFEDDVLTGANRPALDMLGLSFDAIGLATWGSLFERRAQLGMQELLSSMGLGRFHAEVTRPPRRGRTALSEVGTVAMARPRG